MGAVIRYGFITKYLMVLFHKRASIIDGQIPIRVVSTGRHHGITYQE